MEHLTDIDIERYLDGNLSLWGQLGVKSHLRDCAECRARLQAAEGERAYLKRMQAGMEKLREADAAIEQSGRVSRKFDGKYN